MSARQGVQAGFAVLGLVVGAYLGSPQLGLAIGTVLGAVVANAAFPLDDIVNRQDNLADVPITSAAIGQMKPLIYGVWPLGGNIIWAYPKIAIEHTETTEGEGGGGKGGFGGPKTVNITTTYRWHGMVALCEGPISRITRIYTDATLIYDESQPAGWTVSRGLPNGDPDAVESDNPPDCILYEKATADALSKFVLFRGTATQEPWAFAEALEDVGEGTLPAYRHTVVVGVTLDLGVTGRVPNLRFEVSTTNEALGIPFAVHWLPDEEAFWSIWQQGPTQLYGGGAAIRYDSRFLQQQYVSLIPSLTALPQGERGPAATTIGQTTSGQDALMILRRDSSLTIINGSTGGVQHRRINPLTATEEEEEGTLGPEGDIAVRPNPQDGNLTTLLYTLRAIDALGQAESHGGDTHNFQRLPLSGTPERVVWNETAAAAYVSIPTVGTVQRITGYSPLSIAESISCGTSPTMLLVASSGQCWVTATGSAAVYRFTTTGDRSAAITVGNAPTDATEASDGFIWIANSGAASVCRVHPTALTVQTFALPAAPSRVMGAVADGACWVLSAAGRWAALMQDDGTYTLYQVPRGPVDLTVDASGNCWIACSTARTLIRINPEETTSLQPESGNALACVVRDLNRRAGVPDEWIDVSGLDGTPVHYGLFGVAAASRPLEDLALAFQFLAVETGTGIKYLFKGGAPVAVVDEDATLITDQNGQGTLTVERAQPQELPTEVNVVYRSPLRHFHTDEQTKTRPTDGPRIPVVQQIAPAFDDAQYAKDLAEILLYEPIFARYAAKLQAPPVATRLEPGDLLTITTTEGHTYDVRLVKSTTGVDNRVEWDTIRHRSYLYEGFQSFPAESPPGEVILPQQPPVELHLVEPVPLPDEAESIHILFAMAKKTTTLQGGLFPLVTIYESTDNQATYLPIKTITQQAVVGTVAAALSPTGLTHAWDKSATIQVVLRVGSPTLTNATEEAPWYAMIGTECIAFTTATLAGEQTYNLTNILRGVRGSEQHVRMHQANETFILLDAGLRLTKRAVAATAVGTTRHYKAVPEGVNISAVTGQAHVLAGISGKPWAPVFLSAMLNGSDWEIRWLHRSRVRGAWGDLAGISYDLDDLRSYTIHFYADRSYTTRIATYTTALVPDPEGVRLFTYTSAQQTADFGAPQAVIYLGIQQRVAGIAGYEIRYPEGSFEAWSASWESESGAAFPGWQATFEYYPWPPSGSQVEAWSANWENEP